MVSADFASGTLRRDPRKTKPLVQTETPEDKVGGQDPSEGGKENWKALLRVIDGTLLVKVLMVRAWLLAARHR
jgi:hypothetical protein